MTPESKHASRTAALEAASAFQAPPSRFWSFAEAKATSLQEIGLGNPVVLYGPPGTGKTRLARQLVQELGAKGPVVEEWIQFHHKFSYEDFIEGYRPDGKGGFEIAPGAFKQFCEKASRDTKSLHVFVIDEFNRAELATTLGEVLFLVEDRKERKVRTAHSGEYLQIPENVAIIGTMNTADRAIAVVDFALRRRFRFIPVWPDYEEMRRWLNSQGFEVEGISANEYCKAACALNSRIAQHRMLNKHMQLGQALFVPSGKKVTAASISDMFRTIVFPQLEAYFGFGREDELKPLLNPKIAESLLYGREVSDADILDLLRSLSLDKQGERAFD